MALGIVDDPALDCALCALGTSRIEAATVVCVRAPAASARGNRQSATACHKIWVAIACTCAGDCEPSATAPGLHLCGRKAQRTGFPGCRRHLATPHLSQP